jgi:protocatechuate 3,4-dioxygenase beta subunit
MPVVLCCLEGKTHEQAGQELRWPKSSVTARLERARQLLQQRLGRRGFALPAGLLAALLAAEASSAAVPATLVLATARLALEVAHGRPAAGASVTLAEGMLRGMARARLVTAAALLLTLGLAAIGAGALAQPKPAGEQPAAPAAAPAADPDQAEQGAVVAGTVTDEAGKPVAGARVWLREDGKPGPHFRAVDADARGRFRFAEVASGNTRVVALAPGRSFAGLSRDLQEGQVANGLKLVLTPPRELRLSVTGEEGKPVAGAVLHFLAWKTPRADWFWLPPEVWQRENLQLPTSDRGGTLVVPGLPRDAVCRGQLRHPDFARTSFEAASPGDKPVAVRLERGWPLTVVAVDAATDKPAPKATVTLTGFPDTMDLIDEPVGPDGMLTVRLGKASHITINVHHPDLIAPGWDRIDEWGAPNAGHVFKATLWRRAKARGRVVDDKTGRPVAGVRLGLNAHGVRQIITFAQSNASGKFEIEGPEGEADVQVLSGRGYWAEQNASTLVHLDPARMAESADLKVKRLPMVRGTVVLPDGKPLARALVVGRADFPCSSVLTDAAGRFEFQMEQQAPYVAVSGCHLTEQLSGEATILFENLLAGKEVRVQLQPETTLTGRVVGGDGKPRAGVMVWLRTETRCGIWSTYTHAATATTDAQGRYRLPGLNRARRYQVALDNKLQNRDSVHTG